MNAAEDRHNWVMPNSPKEGEELSRRIGCIGFANLPKKGKINVVRDRRHWLYQSVERCGKYIVGIEVLA